MTNASAPPSPPHPGGIFNFQGAAPLIDLKHGTFTLLNDADHTYDRPLTILVKGEWTQKYIAELGDNGSRCSGIIAGALTFRSADKDFNVTTEAGRAIAKVITGKPLPPGRKTRAGYADMYVMVGWPANRELSVALGGNQDDQTCPENAPVVLIWEQNPLNLADPFRAVLSKPPFLVRP